MNLTTAQLIQLIKEETEICKKEYSICVKDVEDPQSDKAVECMDEMNDCEQSQAHKRKFDALKAKSTRPQELSPEDVKAGLEAYIRKWWSFPEQKDAKWKISRKFEFDKSDWFLNRKTKVYRFGAGKKHQKHDHRKHPGYKEVMASVWSKYEKCFKDAADQAYTSSGNPWEQQSYYDQHLSWCEQEKLAPIENWLRSLKREALKKYEKENLNPEVIEFFKRHEVRKDKIASLKAKGTELRKDAEGWDAALSSIEYMHESKKNIKVTAKQLKQMIQEETFNIFHESQAPPHGEFEEPPDPAPHDDPADRATYEKLKAKYKADMRKHNKKVKDWLESERRPDGMPRYPLGYPYSIGNDEHMMYYAATGDPGPDEPEAPW